MPRPELWIVTPRVHRRGGTERSIAEQIERWRGRFRIRLYTMRTEGVDLEGVEVRRIPSPPGPELIRYVWWYAANRAVRAWDTFIGGRRPEILHSTGVNCPDADVMSVHVLLGDYFRRVRAGLVADLADPRRVPRAAHRLAYWGSLAALERWVYRGPAHLWTLSSRGARELEDAFARPSGSVGVVPHGVDAVRFSPQVRLARRDAARSALGVESARVLLMVANDTYNKGVDVAVRALARLPRDRVLAIAGSPDADVVRAWALDVGVDDRVRLWPSTPEVVDYYAAADIYVAPSRGDTFGQPIVEAAACGLPVVVSALAGASELVTDGVEGVVLDDPEDVDALAAAIDAVLDGDPGAMGRAARAMAERDSWDENARRAGDLLEHEVRTPRFLVLAPDAAGNGGIERATRTLLQALGDAFGPERDALLSVWGSGGDLPPCRVLRRGTPGAGARPVRWDLQLTFALSALAAGRRWRRHLVVVACHPHLAPVAVAVGRLCGAPVVTWCHGDEVWGPLRPWVAAALRASTVVLAPSRFTATQAERNAGLRHAVRVIPHGLPPGLEGSIGAEVERSPALVLAVARLVPEDAYKGVDTLLEAWPSVRGEVGAAELVVVGGGSDRARLEAAAPEGVRFVGRVSDEDLRELYARAAVFALPTRATLGPGAGGEGFGLVFLEAAAFGVPAVAGRAGAVPEVVLDDETGLLVRPEDPAEIATAIARLLSDEGLRRALAERARERAVTERSFEAFREAVRALVEDLEVVPSPEPRP